MRGLDICIQKCLGDREDGVVPGIEEAFYYRLRWKTLLRPTQARRLTPAANKVMLSGSRTEWEIGATFTLLFAVGLGYEVEALARSKVVIALTLFGISNRLGLGVTRYLGKLISFSPRLRYLTVTSRDRA